MDNRTLILKAASEGSFDKVWSTLVEKKLAGLSHQKKRGKYIGFALSLAMEVVNAGVSIESILTPEFVACWHSNLSDREHRHHEAAVELKNAAVVKVTSAVIERILELVNVVHPGDLLISLTLAAIKSGEIEVLTRALAGLKKLTETRADHYVVLTLEAMSKREEMVQAVLPELFLRAKHDNLARRKLFSILTRSKLSVITRFFESWEQKPTIVWERYLSESASTEPTPVLGKRKATTESTVTNEQKQALWKLVLLVALESAFDPSSTLHEELLSSVEDLLHPKPKKRTKADSSSALESLFDTLITLLSKQAVYRRELVKETFKAFVHEVPISVVTTLCSAVLNGEGFVMEDLQDDIMGEELDITAAQAEAMLSQTVPSKTQVEGLKTDYRLRACDLMEVMIKKSEDTDALMEIFKTLYSAVQLCKQASLKSRLVGLLGKISKAKLKLRADNIEAAVSLLMSMIKTVASQAVAGIRHCVLSLIKAIAEIDFEKARIGYFEVLRLYITKHSCKELYSLLTQLLSSLPALADDSLAKTLIKYSTEAKQKHSQLQALSLLKLVLSKNSTSVKTSKLLKKTLKTKIKASTLPSKDWIKKILGVIALSCKKSGYTEGLAKLLQRLDKKFAGALSVHGAVIQVKSALVLT